jgi:WD40 repeat protein
MRKLMVAAFLMTCTSTSMFATQTIAKVQLPCESGFQALSPTGAQLAVQCKDKSLYLVGIPQGTSQQIVPAKSGLNAFVFSPDGRWLAAGFVNGTVEVVSTGDKTASKPWPVSSHRIDLLYFFPASKSLFVGPVDSPGTVWDTTAEAPMLRATLPVDFGGIDACAVSPDGKLLVAAGDDTLIRWYDTATWKMIREDHDFLLETFALEFTADGKQLLVGGADSRLTIFDAASGKRLRQFPPQAGSSIGSVDVLSDPPRAVTVYFDNAGEKPPQALLWDLGTATSTAMKSDAPPTCGGVVGNKLWVCSTDGATLTVRQQE